ncbi:MAG: DUF58 domain-containing protein [Acidobacteriota bacterium]|nr:DUF58 domain-containing protein [Acidobacteriota bacterium]
MSAERVEPGFYSSLPRAGKLTLVAIAMVLVPAYGLSVSLMYLMGAMLAGILVYNMATTYFTLRGLSLRILDVPRLHAGVKGEVPFELINNSALFSAGYLELTLTCEGLQLETLPVDWLSRKQRLAAVMPVLPPRRGQIRLERVRLSTAYPFGLFARHKVLAVDRELLVYPALLDAEPNILGARRREPGVLPRNSEDFQYLAAYQPGDDVRRIHWRKSTLSVQPVLKKDLAQLQSFQPRLFVPDACPQFEYAVSALATHFHHAQTVQGWAVVTDEGIREAVSSDDLMRILALIQPVSAEAASRDYEAEGFRTIYASAISMED